MSPRRTHLPAHVVGALPLSHGEKVDFATALQGSDWLALSPVALYLAHDAGTEVTVARFEYWQVRHAELDPESQVVRLQWVESLPDTVFAVPDSADRLTRVLHQRITSATVMSRRSQTPGGEVAVAIRRKPDGSLISQVLAEPGVDLGDPQVAAVAAELEAALREACGLGPRTC